MSAATAVSAIPLNPSFGQRLANMDRAQRMRLGLGIVLFLAVGIIGLVMGRQAEWRVLYADLADKDGGAIVAQLTQMNVPYQYGAGGGTILVPANQVYDTRLKLASQGLPKGSVTGFELMDTANRFGMTQFQERLTFQRGLEGELTRSIQALGSVQSARVHLALPNQNGFFRDQQKPSASVLLSLANGRSLDRSQLAGIIHLVSSSVPEMDPKAVSVLDDTGKLLSTPPDGEAGVNGGDAQQLQHVQQIEQLYSNRIMDILEPVVGRQNVRAQVTAELDFSQTESTSELFKPNQTPDATAIRSQQLMESGAGAGSGATATGVPGATTNQPPGPTGAAINGAPQALAAAGAASGAGNGRRESIINYEVDKTVRVVRGSTGMIKRISAAVILNHKTSTDAKGKVTTAAMSDAELEKMTALVRETIGFSKDRGDSVNVVTAPFTIEKPTVVELPIWQQPEVLDLARSLAWPVGTLLFGALVLMGAVRPALKVLAETPAVHQVSQAATLDALESDQPERPLLAGPSSPLALPAEPDPGEISLEEARKLTRDNPAAVANIVKTWINGEAPA